ncbi:hypothetical protein [Sphingobacterium endophyticum]|uniref:hypothetical protein n=1 Tax=Sphingobacterium endophyticum TaxID=2546448 RepID=UPI0012E18128|nr:hypothetical protein [Sphingobacterium endophyticum]
MKFHVINDLYYKAFHAGYKARNDVFEIIKSDFPDFNIYKFYKIPVKDSKFRLKRILSRRFANYTNFLTFKKYVSELGSDDVVLILIPFESLFEVAKAVYSSLYHAKVKTGLRIIMMIIDLDSIRRRGQINPENEIEYLNFADILISQNEEMSKWLSGHGIAPEKLVNLNLFDFKLHPEHKVHGVGTDILEKNIVFGGNLTSEKAAFIYQWKPKFKTKLYGINLNKGEIHENMEYLGVFDPSNPTMDVSGISFGLVWEGNSMDTCTGLAGQYLKYSTPHKMSLYLSQGLPVIVWEESAMAKIVVENNIGFTIKSLNEIDEIFENITLKNYQEIRLNVQKIQDRVINGNYLKNAISKCISKFNAAELQNSVK